MIKFLGFVIIVVSSTMIGVDLSDKYKRRSKEIKAIINILEKVKSELCFSNRVITDAFKNALNVRCETVHNLFKHIIYSVEKNNVTLSDAFELYVSENNRLSVEKNCIDELNRFFTVFGSGDAVNEIENIENTITNMKEYLELAKNDERRYVKLFRTSGVLAGFLIAIILA